MTDTRIRLNIVSEVALEGGQPRPIHMFRPGTFTDMNGRETSFSQEDVAGIVARFSKRRKLPITERHDFGQAIGRLQDVWADGDGNLFGLPKWNAKGKALLDEEIYDGFSCELDHDEGGWALIGGSLTNYPAVGGLEPVTLAAPPLDSLAALVTRASLPDGLTTLAATESTTTNTSGVQMTLTIPPLPSGTATSGLVSLSALPAIPPSPIAHTPQPTNQGVTPMSDPIAEPVALEAPSLPPISDPTMQARLDAYVAQINARYEVQQQQVLAQASAEFERRMREMEQRSAIEAFARRCASTTADQPYAIPAAADELIALLLETPSAVRGKWQALLNRITKSGLLSFDEIGSSGGGGEQDEQWTAVVNAKVAAGLSKVDAIKAAGKEHPDLYAAQSRRGGR